MSDFFNVMAVMLEPFVAVMLPIAIVVVVINLVLRLFIAAFPESDDTDGELLLPDAVNDKLQSAKVTLLSFVGYVLDAVERLGAPKNKRKNGGQ